MVICAGMSSGCLLYFIVATNKKVPPWYAVLTGSVVDSDDSKIDIFLLTSKFFETFLTFLAQKMVSHAA